MCCGIYGFYHDTSPRIIHVRQFLYLNLCVCVFSTQITIVNRPPWYGVLFDCHYIFLTTLLFVFSPHFKNINKFMYTQTKISIIISGETKIPRWNWCHNFTFNFSMFKRTTILPERKRLCVRIFRSNNNNACTHTIFNENFARGHPFSRKCVRKGAEGSFVGLEALVKVTSAAILSIEEEEAVFPGVGWTFWGRGPKRRRYLRTLVRLFTGHCGLRKGAIHCDHA